MTMLSDRSLGRSALGAAVPADPFAALTHFGRRYLMFVAALIAVLATAFTVLVTQQWSDGLGVTGLNNRAVWGLYIVNFVFLIGTSAGGILVAALVHAFGIRRFVSIARIAELVALVSLLMAMIFIMLDLGRPDRFMSLLFKGRLGSPLIWDFWIMSIYFVITALLGYLATRRDMVLAMEKLPRRRALYRVLTLGYSDISDVAMQRDHKLIKILAILAVGGAVALHSITAWLLGLVKAQPGWHNPLLAPLFIVSAVVSGLAMIVLVVSLLRNLMKLQIDNEVITRMGRLLLWVLPVLGYMLFAELLTTVYAGEPSRLHIFQDMVLGRFAPIFWFDVVIGLLVPGLLLLVKGRSTRFVTVAAAMVVAGIYAERTLIVLPSQLNREFPPGSAGYAPTGAEWWVVAGVWAFGILMLTVLAKVFPLVPVDEQE